MSSAPSQFYITGGTLHPDAACYVERNADRKLYHRLQRGEFCYVLTSRQMGKSSLMVRCATRLRADGGMVAALDLTAIGQNLTPEQWYDGLTLRLARQTRLEEEIEIFWNHHRRMGPVQRFFSAIREVILPQLAAQSLPGRPAPAPELYEHSGSEDLEIITQLVIFVDEIDTVRSLPFSTDEFFAAIRECYNRRVEDPLFKRVAFCLLGVATPSDLIRDTQRTPFNIGHRVELNDFTEEEAAPLAQGLGRPPDLAAPLLKRIFFWTHGHPYLTQRLCQAVAIDRTVREPRDVDRICHDLFLTARARERDDNLLFVRDRILRSGADVAGLLTLYDRARRGKCRISEEEASGLLSVLRLSGIIRLTEQWCLVRNRIYRAVFDGQWVKANMPDAELQRQRKAYRRGILWSASVAAVIIAILGLLISYAFQQSYLARTANADLERANQQTRSINSKLVKTLRELRWQNAEELLAVGKPGDALAYFAHFLRLETNNPQTAIRAVSVLNQNNFALPLISGFRHESRVLWAEFSPDESRIATASEDGTARIWDARTAAAMTAPLVHDGPVNQLAFSPDGRFLVTASEDTNARIWSVQSGQLLHKLRHGAPVLNAIFSPDGRMVLTGAGDRTARLWNPEAGTNFALPHSVSVTSVQFSPDGRLALTPSGDRTAQSWNVETGATNQVYTGHTGRVRTADFSADGQLVVTASDDQTARVYEAATGRTLCELRHKGAVRAASFSPDGSRVATASEDQTARVWDARTGLPLCEALRHKARVITARFSPDGQRILTASRDGTARVWNARTGEPLSQPLKHGGEVTAGRFNADGRHILTASFDGSARLWDVLPGQQLVPSLQHKGEVRFACFSPNGEIVLTCSSDRTAQLWQRETALPLHTNFLQHGGRVRRGQFSPDGKLVVTAASDDQAQVWEVATGRPVGPPLAHRRNVLTASFSPDGRRVITASADRTSRIWEVGAAGSSLQLLGHSNLLTSATFSPDGDWVLTTSVDGTARLWNARTGAEVWRMEHGNDVESGAFSTAGPFLATGSGDKTAVIRDYQQRKVVAVLSHPGPVRWVRFSPDGKTLVSGDDRSARLWTVPTGQLRTRPLMHEGPVWSAQFSADSRLIVTASDDQTARLWDAATGQPLSEPFRNEGAIFSADFSPDGKFVVTASSDRAARVWELPELNSPPPDWLADLVEGVAGQRFTEEGFLQPISPDVLLELKGKILASNAADPYTRWAKWFFADRTKRTISANASMTAREYVARREAEGNITGLLEALRWPFDDALVYARLARELLNQSGDPGKEIQSDWYGRRALALAPERVEVWTARADCLAQLGRFDDALQAVNRALVLAPANSDAALTRARIHYRNQHWPEALDDLNTVLSTDAANREGARLKAEVLRRLPGRTP